MGMIIGMRYIIQHSFRFSNPGQSPSFDLRAHDFAILTSAGYNCMFKRHSIDSPRVASTISHKRFLQL